jgi:YbbR domain-containing protein
MPLIKLTRQESRKLSLFFVCLFFAIMAWLFFALSNRYVYYIKTVVHYIDFPDNKSFHPLQSDTVKLQIEGTGWQLLFSKLRIKPQSVDVSLKGLKKLNYITFMDQLSEINKQFDSNQKLVYVQPDTLYFDFSERSLKRIPIKLVHNIQFIGQYNISGKIKVTPEYVTVTGPFEDLIKMDVWETDILKLNKISKTVSTQVFLKSPYKANINIYPAVADVVIPVDEFTEKVIEVPVKILNSAGFDAVKLLPDKVKITFMTALSNYPKIDKDLFEVTADLNNWKNKKYKQLPLKISRFPDYCKLVKIEPQNTDFIIYK